MDKKCECAELEYSHERILTGEHEGVSFLVSTCRECGAAYRSITGHEKFQVVNLNGNFLDANAVDAIIVDEPMPIEKQRALQRSLANSFPESKATLFFGMKVWGVHWPELLSHDLGLTHICPDTECLEGFAFPGQSACPECGTTLIELPNPKTNETRKEK